MFKIFPSVNARSWALPLGVARREFSDGSITSIQFLCFALNFAYQPERALSPHVDEELSERRKAALRRNDHRMTKKYADGRQKAPRNRKRKPSKAMANLYQLGKA